MIDMIEEQRFSEEDFDRAFRLVMKDSEARELARLMTEGLEGTERGRYMGVGLTEDTLILLSLVSPQLARKTEALLNAISSDWRNRRRALIQTLTEEGKL